MQPVDIIIPTYDNVDQMIACVNSILQSSWRYPVRVILVNNGDTPLKKYFLNNDAVLLIENGKNLGWCGGLEEGLKHSNSEFVMFANDDIFVPKASEDWLEIMVRDMKNYSHLGAIGPTSNCVSGKQNIWSNLQGFDACTTYLIGFCMLLRREALDKAGGIQEPKVGGDDLDLSIRLRNAGYMLLVKNSVFVYHHGFQTGTKLYGDHNTPGGWNSQVMIEDTNMELIRKHGFIKWHETMMNSIMDDYHSSPESKEIVDTEGNEIRDFWNNCIISGNFKVVELGCGNTKTIENSIGVDIFGKGEIVPMLNKESVADIKADVTNKLPFDDDSIDCIIARHVLEHSLNVVKTLSHWKASLKQGGILIIACPDETFTDGVSLNPDHKHAFTAESLRDIAELVGFKYVKDINRINGVSFILILEK